MKPKIILAGGTGFIGRFLEAEFRRMGHDVILISRQRGHVSWDDREALINALENSSMLINLAGKSVDCRYNEKNKKAILSSRTATTRILGELVLQCANPPALWINSSTATIYRHAEDRPMTEARGEIGKGFSVDVATRWEQTFFAFDLPHTRQVALRMAIVLGKNGGVIQPFVRLVRFGLGGIQGNGRQRFSWIHLADVLGIIQYIQAHPGMVGVYNCSAPGPVTNAELMRTFRQRLHPPFALPSPAWLLEIGAALIGTETELLLKSRWVIPERLLEAGYTFQYPGLEGAVEQILSNKRGSGRDVG